MKRIWVVVLLALIAACASTEKVDEELAIYFGKNIKEVIEELGKPSNVDNMQNGTWQYRWTRESKFSKGIGASFMGVPLAKKTSNSCTKILIVDQRKIIVDYGTEGKC